MTNISVAHFLKTIGASLTNDAQKQIFSIATPSRVFTFVNDDFGVAQSIFEGKVAERYVGVAVSTLTSRAGFDVKSIKALCEVHGKDKEKIHQIIARRTAEIAEAYDKVRETTTGTFLDAIQGAVCDRYKLGEALDAELQYLLSKYPNGDEIDGYFCVSKSSLDFDAVLKVIADLYDRETPEGYTLSERFTSELEPALDSVGEFIYEHFERDFNSLDNEEKRNLFWGDSDAESFSKGKRAKFASYYPVKSMLVSAFIDQALINYRADGLLTTMSDEQAKMLVARQVLRLRGSFVLDRVSGLIVRGVKPKD